LSQIRRLGECLRAAESFASGEADFIRIASAWKKVLLGQARLGALWKMRIVAAFPFQKSEPYYYEQKFAITILL
jgi:hypothetical protein